MPVLERKMAMSAFIYLKTFENVKPEVWRAACGTSLVLSCTPTLRIDFLLTMESAMLMGMWKPLPCLAQLLQPDSSWKAGDQHNLKIPQTKYSFFRIQRFYSSSPTISEWPSFASSLNVSRSNASLFSEGMVLPKPPSPANICPNYFLRPQNGLYLEGWK